MSSRLGSAFAPSSRTASPLTVTRPSSISCSDARRDATPACDKIFCSRSTSTVYHEVTTNTKHTANVCTRLSKEETAENAENAEQYVLCDLCVLCGSIFFVDEERRRSPTEPRTIFGCFVAS